jgi:Kunitz/Bovine pancreatic trypsin inhibitor domain
VRVKWLKLVVCAALVGCFGPDDGSNAGDAGGSGSGGGAAAGGTGGAGGSGGAPDGGARDGGAHRPDATMSFDGGSADTCSLPVDIGPCDAAIPRWGFAPELGGCVQFSHGGCEGNGNNFESAVACLAACAPSDGGAGCLVGGVAFPDGADGIDDPFSCNSCLCIDGTLACTEIACPEACPPNGKASTSCAACGPVDNCELVEHGCLLVCSDDDQCAGTGHALCLDGVCRDACG